MSPTETYTYLRQAGFSHAEALKAINQGVKPNLNTKLKKAAYDRLKKGGQRG